jgi:AAA+ superfamily predicted ATPase
VTTYEELELAIRARLPLIAVVTPEEARAEERLLKPLAAAWREGRLFAWSLTQGYSTLGEPEGGGVTSPAPDPLTALDVIAGYEEPALFVLKDFHHHVESAAVLRKLRDLSLGLPSTGKHVIFLGPRFRVPEDLEKEVQVIDYPPPGLEELDELLTSLEEWLREGKGEVQLSGEGRSKLLSAALGLTVFEAESVLAKAVLRDGGLTDAAVELVLSEKKQIVRRGGLLEFYEAQEALDDIGGLGRLKGWLARRQEAFSEEAREFGLPAPKGILVLGVQGCGKSLLAKAVSREWRMPLLRLDVGRVFGKFIGESEAAIRQAIRTAEAVAPCILWIDEIEKGFAGATADANDTGVGARVLGTFLTWMQEKRHPVFVFATANQIRTLPPELLRKGRFDELFFVDLPTPDERAEIFGVHLRKRRRDPAAFDLAALAERTEGYTGAEIEQIVNEGLYAAFGEGRRAVTQDDLLHAAGEVVPLSVTMKEALAAMRHWASARARRAS